MRTESTGAPDPLDSASANEAPTSPLVVVGFGASAGGLEAMQQVLAAMPWDTGHAFVLIQHLDPTRKTMLPEILRGATRMRVLEAEDKMLLEPDTLYTSPPDREVAIVHGKLQLVEPLERHASRLPIDFFFRSLAQEVGNRAIAIVLSGTGTDGTLGVRAVKGAGGLTIAQETSSARYDGMPRSAIGTHLVNFVVPPTEIPRVLLEYAKHPYLRTSEVALPTATAQLDQIFSLLREQTGHDFSRYKQNTIRRRIERRMAVHQQRRLEDYVRYLEHAPVEVDALFKDLLIGVTNFFREPESFRSLEEKVIPKIIETTRARDNVRIWVPGCSTGEEAYSLAIVVAERLEVAKVNRKVTIFGTDIDPESIDTARTALYPDNIVADVSEARLERFFTKEGGAYRIAKRVRETVIFALQDALKDPPFSKLDLISCRNLLIYLGPELQKKLMQLFHAVLNGGGFLFLGSSETVGDAVISSTRSTSGGRSTKSALFQRIPSSV